MEIKSAVIGFIIGDALGVPVEFESREKLLEDPVTGMRAFGTYGMPAGSFSDDSSMLLATMASIANNNGEIIYDDIMEQFIEWWKNSKYTQYDNTFDIGSTTAKALNNYLMGSEPLESGLNESRNNGNGSLMRILPLAYVKDIDKQTIEDISSLTHAHKRSKLACVFYVELIKSILEDKKSLKEHIKIASDKIKELYSDSRELNNYKRILDGSIFDEDLDSIISTGYVLATLESVVYVLGNTDNYKDAVLMAVNLGGDTDTIAAVAGGVAGLYYGYDEIPDNWISQIKGIEKVLELCEKFAMAVQ